LACLVIGAGGAGAEGLLADYGVGRLVVDVEVAGHEAQLLVGRSGCGTVLGDDAAA